MANFVTIGYGEREGCDRTEDGRWSRHDRCAYAGVILVWTPPQGSAGAARPCDSPSYSFLTCRQPVACPAAARGH
jgi:hypothetical protein